MRLVGIKDLESGDVLAKAVFGRNGIVMLEAGTVLTEQYINRLQNLRVSAVHIQSKAEAFISEPNAAPRIITSAYHSPWISPNISELKNNDKARQQAVERVSNFVEQGFVQDRISLPVPEELFRKRFRDILLQIASERVFSDELGVMLQTDTYLFEHALNVVLCANILGTAQGYDETQLYEVSLGSLFCDIGMTRLPTDLIKLNRELTEAERNIMRQHTNEGYRVLKGIKEVPLLSAQVALMHHERYRGEGYPMSVNHASIPEYAQIAGLADVYNALISPRHYRQSYSVEEATEYLFAAGNYEFNVNLVKIFLKHLTLYPVSTVVRLSNGEIGAVVETMGRPSNRPVVQIFCDINGVALQSPYIVDLMDLKGVYIVGKA
ncbi:MAG: HD domain-containing protein [Candidatus Cohnella colombiensis]|uniref:HD domain-containing protein n=1 Tax=Candidatus Cohnella colombiensis TaxID=3121368 RepID=A0AA95JCI3_9BACL|nr:MAG: HD domain-containing protein [Cohnella sp.]